MTARLATGASDGATPSVDEEGVAAGAGIGEVPSMAENRVTPGGLAERRVDWTSEQTEVKGSHGLMLSDDPLMVLLQLL